MRIKESVYYHLNYNNWVVKFIYALILLNVFALVLESYKDIQAVYEDWFYWFEVASVAVFTVEYFLRIWSADVAEDAKGGPLKSRIAFIFSTYGLIDLIAILPFYLPMFLVVDMRVVRILRLFRLLRIFKLGRFSNSMQLIGNILKETRSELTITIFTAFILIIFSSTLMFYIENEAQPDSFVSIGHSVWWSVATLTTVGYGDIYPITPMGKFLGAIIAIIGIGFVALPTGIISSAFISKIQENKEKNMKHICECPACGTRFEQ